MAESPSAKLAIARGIFAGWLQLAIAIVVGPVYTIVVLSALPRIDAGFWLVLVSLVMYMNLFDAGLGPTVTRLVAFSVARGSSNETRLALPDIYWTSRRLFLIITVSLLVLAAVAGWFVLPSVIGLEWNQARQAAWFLFVLGSAAAVYAAHPLAIAAGVGRVSLPRYVRAVSQVVGLVLAAVSLVAGYGLVGIAVAWAAQNTVLLAAIPLVRQRVSAIKVRAAFDPTLARRMVRPSLQWAGTNLGGALILASGAIIVASRVSVAAVPQFAVSKQLVETLFILALTPAQIAEPFLSSAAAMGDKLAFVELLRVTLRRALAILAVGTVVVAAFGREIIHTWVGSANFIGYPGLWLLLALYALEAHHVVHAIAVMATGRIVFFPVAMIGGVLTVALGSAFGPIYGVTGVVLGMMIAQLVSNNWYVPWYSLRTFGITAQEYISWLSPFLLLAAATAVLVLLARWALSTSGVTSPVGLLLVLGALGAAVTPLMFAVGLTAAERDDLMRRWRRAWRR